ncbi:sulfurtransferase [Salinicoccus bachuensis]|uniref:thiosulfate sulfurtransferase n=1 Tax=Salinicoccus bachuensis TaxID=3136731 RepID=A0ABZ3CG50_9STAP
MTIIDGMTTADDIPENLVLVDCRNVMDDVEASQRKVDGNPITGAVHVPQRPWMFDADGLNAGRHPIPRRSVVAALHQALKQDAGDTLLLIDDEKQFFHTRLYYLFRLYGFNAMLWNDALEHLDLLSAEFRNNAGSLPSEDLERKGTYEDAERDLLAVMDEVREAVDDEDILLIDVRARVRYLGEEEPIDHKMGHIPGAVNIPYGDLFHSGRIDFDALGDMRDFLGSFREIIVYCGSGMSATPAFLVLHEMGLPVKLYGGSFSEWITDGTNSIETGDSPLNERIVSQNE